MFEERIKDLRTSLGLNQVQFGRKLSITKQCVSNWENGNIMPSVDMLIKICTIFSVSSDYLLGLENKCTLDVTGLTNEQILHIKCIVDDLKDNKKDSP